MEFKNQNSNNYTKLYKLFDEVEKECRKLGGNSFVIAYEIMANKRLKYKAEITGAKLVLHLPELSHL